MGGVLSEFKPRNTVCQLVFTFILMSRVYTEGASQESQHTTYVLFSALIGTAPCNSCGKPWIYSGGRCSLTLMMGACYGAI